MDFFQKIWNKRVETEVNFSKIGTELIAPRLAKQGITLSDKQREDIEARLEDGEDTSSFTIEIEDRDTPEHTHRVIDLAEGNDLEDILNEIQERHTDAIPSFISESSKLLLETLKSDAPRMLKEHKQVRNAFEARLSQTWETALDLLEMLIVITSEAGATFNHEYRPQAVKEHNLVFEALTRLHARGCQVAYEVLTLMRAGFADGAHARWRTLHEIAVMAWFIKDRGNDVAERYLLHDTIESYKAAIQHQRYSTRLNEKSISDKELAHLQRTYEQLLNQFGADYKNSYGWASQTLGKRDPKFSDIEEAVALDHWRPYYKLASHNVHANPKGVFFKLSLHERSSLLTVPSTGPAHSTRDSSIRTVM